MVPSSQTMETGYLVFASVAGIAGTASSSVVALCAVKLFTATSPNLTALTLSRLRPLKLSAVPTVPLAGVKESYLVSVTGIVT